MFCFCFARLEQSNDRVGVRYAWFHTLCMVPQGCRADRYDGQTSGPTHAALIFCTLHWPPGKTLYRRTELLRGGSDPKHVLSRFTVLLPNARGASKETLDSDAAERRHPLPLFLPPLGLKIAMIAVASLSRVSSDSSRA